MNKTGLSALLVVVLAVVVSFTTSLPARLFNATSMPPPAADEQQADNAHPTYQRRHHRQQITHSGRVIALLPDDNSGSRHQRFIVRLASGQTLLVAHNLDLAPRVDALAEGDAVAFSGEYAWNAKGGVVHWTHHDPDGSHPGGWLKHHGRQYR